MARSMNNHSNNWNQAQVTKAIRQCAREVGGKERKTLKITEYRKWSAGKNLPRVDTIYELFETWPNACRAAGLALLNANIPVVPMSEVDQAMAAAVKHHQQEHGDKPMRERDYQAMVGNVPGVDISLAVILRACGRWSDAGEKYDFVAGRVKALTDHSMEEWAGEIRKICQQAGGPLSIRQFNEEKPWGFPTSRRLATAFDNWNELLIKAGYSSKQIAKARQADRMAVAARCKQERQLQLSAA